jgi:hypothetical protein
MDVVPSEWKLNLTEEQSSDNGAPYSALHCNSILASVDLQTSATVHTRIT